MYLSMEQVHSVLTVAIPSWGIHPLYEFHPSAVNQKSTTIQCLSRLCYCPMQSAVSPFSCIESYLYILVAIQSNAQVCGEE